MESKTLYLIIYITGEIGDDSELIEGMDSDVSTVTEKEFAEKIFHATCDSARNFSGKAALVDMKEYDDYAYYVHSFKPCWSNKYKVRFQSVRLVEQTVQLNETKESR